MAFDKVIVTGGSGLLGRYMVRELQAHGHGVTVFDLKPPEVRPIDWRVLGGGLAFGAAIAARTKQIHIGTSVQNVIRGFSSDRLRVLLGTSFFFNAGFTFFTTFFGVYLANKFGFTQSVTGDYFALVGLFIAITQAVLVPRIARHLIDFKVMRFSYFGLAVAMAFYFTAGSKWQLYAIIPIFTAFNGMSMANLTSLISRSAEPGRQGEAMGISSSVMNLAQVPASVLVGYITGSIGSSTPLVVSCACIGAAGLVFWLFFRPTFVHDTPMGAGGGAAAAH